MNSQNITQRVTASLFALACVAYLVSMVIARVLFVNDWLSASVLAVPISMNFGLVLGYNAERLRCQWLFTKHDRDS